MHKDQEDLFARLISEEVVKARSEGRDWMIQSHRAIQAVTRADPFLSFKDALHLVHRLSP